MGNPLFQWPFSSSQTVSHYQRVFQVSTDDFDSVKDMDLGCQLRQLGRLLTAMEARSDRPLRHEAEAEALGPWCDRVWLRQVHSGDMFWNLGCRSGIK